MQHSFRELLRKGGTGQYTVLHRKGAIYGGLSAPSIKAQVPRYDEMRDGFGRHQTARFAFAPPPFQNTALRTASEAENTGDTATFGDDIGGDWGDSFCIYGVNIFF